MALVQFSVDDMCTDTPLSRLQWRLSLTPSSFLMRPLPFKSQRANIKKGVIMMQGLLEDRYSDRDCLYYMALGYYRLDDVVSSRKCLEKLLKLAPNCRQAISLKDIVEDKITKDGVIGISIVSGIAVVGGLLAAAFAGTRSSPR